MVLLSIAINVWPGTDFYRFALLLETLLYRPSDINDYLNLAQILNGWNPRERSVPNDKFKNAFAENNFKRVLPSRPDELELILAMDGDINNALVEMNLGLEDYFVDFCKSINVHYQILHKTKLGVSAMRNAVMQTFNGDYLMFKDDDDFSACLEDLYFQAHKLKELGMGTNDPSYWNIILNRHYDDIFQLQRDLWKYQKKPVIAMLLNNIRIKNVWGTKENPFSIAPLPLDTNGAVLVNRPSAFSMCTKVFSRESLPLIYNSINLGSLEDSRSYHTQAFPQKGYYVFKNDLWKMFNNGYDLFKKYIANEDLTKEEFDDVKYFWKWCNLNLLPSRYIEIHMNRDDPNLTMLDMLRQYFINIDVCTMAYTFPSGHYSRNSWSWAALVGTLEAYRVMHKQVDFTILDLQRAHKFISNYIHTDVLTTNCDCDVKSLVDDPDCNEIASILNWLANYKYIYWRAIVNKKSDWPLFTEKLLKLKELLNKIENKEFSKKEGADKIQETPIHPNSTCEIEIITDGNKCTKTVSMSNTNIVTDVDLLRSNYTETFMPKTLQGGDAEYPEISDVVDDERDFDLYEENVDVSEKMFDEIQDETKSPPNSPTSTSLLIIQHECCNCNDVKQVRSPMLSVFGIMVLSFIVILIVGILMRIHGYYSSTQQQNIHS